MLNKKLLNQGMSMMEVVVAIMVAGILGVTMMALVIKANATANSAKLKAEATKLAEQNLEIIRQYRAVRGWGLLYSFANENGEEPDGICLVNIDGGNEGPVDPNPVPPNFPCQEKLQTQPNGLFNTITYLRRNTDAGSPPQVIVSSYVTFNDHGKTEVVKLTTYFADIQ